MNVNEIVDSESAFILADGRVIYSVSQLLEIIRTLEESIFRHHVNSNKNDFVNWIEFVARK